MIPSHCDLETILLFIMAIVAILNVAVCVMLIKIISNLNKTINAIYATVENIDTYCKIRYTKEDNKVS